MKHYVYYSLGAGAARGPEQRRYSWGLTRFGGYPQFFGRVRAIYKKHPLVDGLFLHLPFSTGEQRLMEYAAMDKVEALIAQGIMPNADYSETAFENELCEFMYEIDRSVICYLGSITEPAMKAVIHHPVRWINKALKAVAPIINAAKAADRLDNLSIGIDSLSGYEVGNDINSGPRVAEDSPEYRFCQTLMALGVKVLCEPHADDEDRFDHLREFGAVVIDEHWHKAWKKREKKDQIKGEVIVLDQKGRADLERLAADENVDSIAVPHERLGEVL